MGRSPSSRAPGAAHKVLMAVYFLVPTRAR